jgi:hypothetical protein
LNLTINFFYRKERGGLEEVCKVKVYLGSSNQNPLVGVTQAGTIDFAVFLPQKTRRFRKGSLRNGFGDSVNFKSGCLFSVIFFCRKGHGGFAKVR